MQFLENISRFYIGNLRNCNRAVKQKISSHMEYAITFRLLAAGPDRRDDQIVNDRLQRFSHGQIPFKILSPADGLQGCFTRFSIYGIPTHILIRRLAGYQLFDLGFNKALA